MMKAQWQKISAQFEALSVRERWMVCVTALVLAVLFVWVAFTGPAWNDRIELQRKIQAAEQEQQRLTVAVGDLRQSLATDIDQPIKQQIAQLHQELESQRQQLVRTGATLIPPERTGATLQSLLEQTHGLSLIRLANAAAIPALKETETADMDLVVMQELPQVYHHPLVLEFNGSYLQAARYLEKVEQEGLPLFWDRFSFVTDAYPDAKVSFQVHTLSLHEGWLGL